MSTAGPARAATIHLLRHAEPLGVTGGRYVGRRSDPPLSERGRRAAEAVARRATTRASWAGVVASPLRRARETAEIVGAARSAALPALIDDRLAEIDFGAFEGLTFAEAEKAYPDATAAWAADPARFVFPDGESMADFGARVSAAGAALRAQAADADGSVLVVAHGGVLRALLAEWLGLADDRAGCFRLGYAGWVTVEFSGGPLGELTTLVPAAEP